MDAIMFGSLDKIIPVMHERWHFSPDAWFARVLFFSIFFLYGHCTASRVKSLTQNNNNELNGYFLFLAVVTGKYKTGDGVLVSF